MLSFEQCRSMFVENGLEYNTDLHDKLSTYSRFLVEYNEKINLTAITDPNEIMVKHFIDSILVCKHFEIPKNASIIDVGTGAGFPSIPLKLYRPDIKITLLDSLNKRIVFLKQLCEKLNIEADTIHGRAEETGHSIEYREKFDIACARAVASLPTLCEYCLPFVKDGGYFLAMKGPSENILNAGNAVKVLKGKIIEEKEYTLKGNDKRKLIIVKKISQIPPKYPRNSGQIKNKPL